MDPSVHRLPRQETPLDTGRDGDRQVRFVVGDDPARQLVDSKSGALRVLFLYRHVLHIEVEGIEHVPRAKMPTRVPVVLSREEVAALVKHLEGTMWIVGALLYGTGLRLQECLDLRVKDIDIHAETATGPAIGLEFRPFQRETFRRQAAMAAAVG